MKTLATLFALSLAAGSSWAQQALSFEQAWDQVQSGSEQLAAAQSALQSKLLQAEGVASSEGPTVSFNAASLAYSAALDVNLDPVNQALASASGRLPIPLQNLPVPVSLPQFPQNYTYTQNATLTTGSVSAVWPLYNGGIGQALHGFVAAQGREAQADERSTEHSLMTLLVQRYFGTQLAARAAALRTAALNDVAEHDAAVDKMLATGVVSRVERLQVRAALEEARRNAQKAQDDAELAAVALARTVHSAAMAPSSPLFVSSQPAPALATFVQAALEHHPGLAKVAAKKAQAEELHAGEAALRRPEVFAFGQRQLVVDNPNWVVGIGLRWTLHDPLDRNKLDAASLQQVAQAEHTDAQARSDIALLVEKNWRQLEQTRQQFLASQPSVDLAQEILRLRKVGLQEGTSTALELMDAETNAAKVQTERAQAAYAYVLALAQLLESCGLSDQFSAYMARADIRVE